MRHRKKRHQLNRFTSWHRATMRGMARSIVIDGSIHTTLAKAKAARSIVEKLIGLSIKGDLTSKRRAFDILQDHALVSRLFAEIGPRFSGVASGYTRIINLGRRRGDDAQVVIFELTRVEKKEKKPLKKQKKAAQPSVEQEAPAAEQAQTGVEKKKAAPPVEAKEKGKPPITQKPSKKFLGGLRKIFKKERDSL